MQSREYLWLLRESLNAAGDDVPTPLRARAEAALDVDPRVWTDQKTFTQDPNAILAARARIAKLIEALRAIRK